MNAVFASLVPWIDAIGRCLLHFLWQGVLIGLAYVAARPLCRTIGQRYRLGMITLVAMIAAPVATLLLMHPGAATQDDPIANAVTTAVPSLGAAVEAVRASWLSQFRWEQVLPWLVSAWLAGVSLIATRSYLHWRRLARIVRTAVPLPRDWQMRLIQMRQRFGVLRPVRLLSSIHVATPTLIGWLKPAILLPASLLSGFTPGQIELIVAHELSHVRRFDYIANLAQVVIETLLFYHPAVYWVSRDVRQSRESCCDDLVLSLGGGDAVAYARTLADLEEMHHDFGTAVPALGMTGGLLLARIRRLVDPSHDAALDPLPRGNGLTLPMLLAGAGLALALMRLHLMPDVLVDALLPRSAVELKTDRSLMAFNLPSLAAVSAVRAVIARPEPVVTPAAPPATTPQRPLLSVAVPVPASAPPASVEAPLPALTAPVLAAAATAEPIAAHVDTPVEAAPPAPPAVVRVPTGPVPSQVVPAHYPLDALRTGITGRVDLEFRIAPDGSVRDVRVTHAAPAGVFDQAATAALRQWRFDVSPQLDLSRRYARSFAFTRSDNSADGCREVTGSHICRKGSSEQPEN